MSQYFVLTAVDWDAVLAPGFEALPETERIDRCSGCVWLFRARPEVDDPEEALRSAVRDFFASPEGRQVRRSEGMETVTWDAALPWIPDEVWDRYGLRPIRHPELERVQVDGGEDVAADLPAADAPRPGPPLATP